MQAVLLSIGDELVLGQTVDANSAWLSARLAEQGITTAYHQTLPDEQSAIAAAIREAAGRAELVLVTGGLGPTADDLTRQALAETLDSPLVEDEASLEQIRHYFEQRGRPVPEKNRVQALRPEAASAILNDAGTAPGIHANIGQAEVYITPGVPREMHRMHEQRLAPALAGFADGRVIRTLKINTFGEGESDIAERLEPLMSRQRNPTVGTTISGGIVTVRLRAEADTSEEADTALAETAADIENRLRPLAFGRDDETLQAAALTACREHELTLATAESCTGGAIGGYLTDPPGSSDVYLGGWVTYAEAMKEAVLGVPRELLQQHGAVSEPVVRAMAEGAVSQSGADVAVAVSGVAGPSGGSEQKPVGTVWIGLACRQGQAPSNEAMRFQLPGDRAAVRDRSAKCALQMIRLHALGRPLDLIRWGRRIGGGGADQRQ